MPRVLVSRFALHAGLVTFRQTFVLCCLGGKLASCLGPKDVRPSMKKSDFCRPQPPVRDSPTAGASDAYSMHIQELGFFEPDLPLIAWRGFLPAHGSREAPARREWLQLGPSTGSILPFGRRAGSHRAAGTCSSVNDQQRLAAVQALSGPRHGKTRIGSFCPTHLS